MAMRLPIIDLPTAQPAHFDTGPRSISGVRVLRISVTDRCNFRCLYCMPEEGVRWLPKDDILSFEEIEQVVRAAIEVHGIRRFKLTGGEPTIRHDIVELVHRLSRIRGVEDLSLTTNGMLLTELARPLKEAGLHRVTVSIDSLDPERFRRITRTGDLRTVLRGLDAAEEVGLGGLKINCVAMRGTNDDEFANFAVMTLQRPITVRFIEYMPLGDSAFSAALGAEGNSKFEIRNSNESPISNHESATKRDKGPGTRDRLTIAKIDDSELGPAGGCGAQDRGDVFISEAQIQERIESALGPLVPVDRATESGVGPAVVYRLASGNPMGRIGFISAMSAPFCSTCNRLRLTANGVLRSCLFEGGEVNVRPVVRSGLAGERLHLELAKAMSDCVRLKPDVHSYHGNEQMSRIGG